MIALIRGKLAAVWRIWKTFKGFRGKFYAIFYIVEEIRDFLKRKTGIWFWLPFSIDRGQLGYTDMEKPVGIYNLQLIKDKLAPLKIKVKRNAKPRINFMLPTIDPKIFFGGYIAAFNLIKTIIDKGYNVRLVVCDPIDMSVSGIRDAVQSNALVSDIINRAEIVLGGNRNKAISVNKDDVYIAYSFWTARLAHSAAQATNGKPFIFLIQELEPIFHHLDSFHALGMSTYKLPHYAIFNSPLLRDFFKRKQIGVFQNSEEEGLMNSVSFYHVLTDVSLPTAEELETRKTKKLLFYARPEAHASRNLFELGMIALQQAIKDGVFSKNWEFYGIGALSFSGDLDLVNGRHMEILRRVSLEKYREMLSWFDIGMSLMYAPHPSVPPLEMAAAGLITVTTTFGNRTTEDMEAISANLIAVEPDVESIAAGLAKAKSSAFDYEMRVNNAQFDWPRSSWEKAYDADFFRKLKSFFTAKPQVIYKKNQEINNFN